MDKSLIIIFYIITFITILSLFNKKDNLDDNLTFNYENNVNESIINQDLKHYKKLEDRRHAMLLEQLKRLSITNNSLLSNQSRPNIINQIIEGTGGGTITELTIIKNGMVKLVLDDDAYNLTAYNTQTINLNSSININSGESSLIGVIIFKTGTDSSLTGGYIGKYDYTFLKDERIYSIEHELNNSDEFKATFKLNGDLDITNKTASDIILTVQVRKLGITDECGAAYTILDDTSFNLVSNGTNSLDISDNIELISGNSTLVSVVVIETGSDSSVSGGYIGKYIHTVMKNEKIYSIDHEINNSINFKCNFNTTSGILKFTNLTGVAKTLHVLIRTFNLC